MPQHSCSIVILNSLTSYFLTSQLFFIIFANKENDKMLAKRVQTIYFSPAHSTREVVKAVAKGVSSQVIHHDITQGIKNPIEFEEGDVVVVGVPSYSGRVPVLATKTLETLSVKGIPTILVCVYGNREYDDTLLELQNICESCGFKVISAGAFIARHSIFPEIAKGRPDTSDLQQAEEFGRKSLEYIEHPNQVRLKLKGNYPYREIGSSIPLKPKGNSKCNQCGTCVALCPVNAIEAAHPQKTDKEKCISCARCIEVCPQKARRFGGLIYEIASKKFENNFSRKKDIELFYPL